MKLVKDLGMMYRTDTSKQKKRMGIYICSGCDNEFTACTPDVKSGNTKGCRECDMKSNRLGNKSRTHGESKDRLYKTWCDIKARCYNKKNTRYKSYGKRGITVCKEWRESYEVFSKFAEENSYHDKLQIDRKDNDGNYEPLNCRFITGKLNSSNKQNAVLGKLSVDDMSDMVEYYHSVKISQRALAKMVNVNELTVHHIINGKDNYAHVSRELGLS